LKSISPRPSNWFATGASKIVRESNIEETRKATLAGKFAFIAPEIIFTDGR
jgi:hypothetical protein